jgi:nitroreductase
METWDAYRARRNVREFSTTAIPSEVLDQILEAGRRAPSAKNRQPWDFVVVTERAALEALSKVWVGAGHVARSAATIVIVTPVENGADAISHAEFDLGQATMAMALMAADHGIGSGHALAHDQEVVRSVIGLPPTHRAAYVLALGFPSAGPLHPIERLDRRPFDEVVHWHRW